MNEELKGAINDRLKSTIFGTFTLYLALINWRVFVYLLSELNAADKINIINEYLQKEGTRNFGVALGITAFTLVVVPLSKNTYDRVLMWWNFGTDSYADSLARQREVLDKNGVDKIIKILSTKGVVETIQKNVAQTRQNIEQFENNHSYMNQEFKNEFYNTKVMLTEISQNTNLIITDLDGFKTEVNRITRFKK